MQPHQDKLLDRLCDGVLLIIARTHVGQSQRHVKAQMHGTHYMVHGSMLLVRGCMVHGSMVLVRSCTQVHGPLEVCLSW